MPCGLLIAACIVTHGESCCLSVKSSLLRAKSKEVGCSIEIIIVQSVERSTQVRRKVRRITALASITNMIISASSSNNRTHRQSRHVYMDSARDLSSVKLSDIGSCIILRQIHVQVR